MKKKVLLVLSFALMLISATVPVVADVNPLPTDNIEISRQDAYYDEALNAYVVSFTLNSDNTLNYLTKAEVSNLNQITESQVSALKLPELSDDLIVKPRGYYEYYRFEKTSGPNQASGARRKVSADFEAPIGGGSVTKHISFTVTETFSANVTNDLAKSAIKAGAGFTWSKSASVGTSYTVYLLTGQIGYIGFTPYYDKVNGILRKYSNWDGFIGSWTASGYSVKKTYDGEADGLYQLVITNQY